MQQLNLQLQIQMPLYKITTIRLHEIEITLFRRVEDSFTLLAGIEVENDNLVGTDVYETRLDVYYPDWFGKLRHIGVVRELQSLEEEDYDNEYDTKDGMEKDLDVHFNFDLKNKSND